MQSKLWFKAKKYGWGWYPVTWQGWVVIAVFIALMFANAYRLEAMALSEQEVLRQFFPQTAGLVTLLLAICFHKGETPHWQWGEKKKRR